MVPSLPQRSATAPSTLTIRPRNRVRVRSSEARKAPAERGSRRETRSVPRRNSPSVRTLTNSSCGLRSRHATFARRSRKSSNRPLSRQQRRAPATPPRWPPTPLRHNFDVPPHQVRGLTSPGSVPRSLSESASRVRNTRSPWSDAGGRLEVACAWLRSGECPSGSFGSDRDSSNARQGGSGALSGSTARPPGPTYPTILLPGHTSASDSTPCTPGSILPLPRVTRADGSAEIPAPP